MKKSFWSMALAMMFAVPAMAQTDFRHISYEEGLKAAQAEKKLLFIDFYTDWCGPCKMMANTVFPQVEVGEYFNAHFVNLKLNAEKEGKELAEKLGVNAYPTFFILNEKGEVVDKKVGGSSDVKGFIDSIDRLINPEKSPERLQQRYEAGERGAEFINTYASSLRAEAGTGRKRDEAKVEKMHQVVNDYYNSLTDEQKLAKENSFLFLTFTESAEEPMGQFLIANRDRFDESIKEKMISKAVRLYTGKLYSWYGGEATYTAEEVAALRKGLKEFNKEEEYNSRIQLLEIRLKGVDEFLSYCEKNYAGMDETLQGWLLPNINALVNSKDKEVLKRASAFVRSHLSDPGMEVGMLYQCVLQINALENPK
jgi:thiol-disulfide isomerase/thioredoxin